MNKLLASAAFGALILGAASASAADLAARPYTKAPPPAVVATVYDWSGFYIGINGGWAESRDRRVFDATSTLFGSYDANGPTVGGQIGYRWQTGGWVFGLEAQGNWADVSGSRASLVLPPPGDTVRSKMDAFGLFTGQLGYAWNNVLLYVKGGAAITDRNYQFLTAGVVTAETGYGTRLGGTVGAGLEFSLAQNWSLGVEYDHIFENRHGATFTTPGGVALTGFTTGGDTDMILGRLNYRFGGPVVARY